MSDWTMPVSYCDICDKDRDPLEVPSESCGHDDSHRRIVGVPMVPARVTDEMVERAALVIAHADGYEGSDMVPSDVYRYQARKVLAAAFGRSAT